MHIGILGTGRIGRTLATLWAQNGHAITLGSREESKAKEVAESLSKSISPTATPLVGRSITDTTKECDIIVFAFPWYALTDIERLVGKLQGKTIIDCINPLTSSGGLALGHKSSAGEVIAHTFPLAKVIKAFNHIYVDHFARPQFSGIAADAYMCSDFDDAKAIVSQLATEMGFIPVDLGPLKHTRYLEPLAVLWIQRAFLLGEGPEFTIKMIPR